MFKRFAVLSVVLVSIVVGPSIGAGQPAAPPAHKAKAKAEVTAPAKVEVEIGWPGTLELSNPDKVPTLVLNLFEDKLQLRREFTDDATVMKFFAFGRTPGEYPIVFVTIKEGRPVESGRTIIVVKGVVPPPPPPGPGPGPNPTPGTKPSWLTIVRDAQNTTVAMATLLNDGPAWQDVLSQGVKFDVLDESQTETQRRFAPVLRTVSLPAVITQKADGAVIYAGPAPTSRAALLKLAKDGKP